MGMVFGKTFAVLRYPLEKRYDVKDKASQEEEMVQFKQLVTDPDFKLVTYQVHPGLESRFTE